MEPTELLLFSDNCDAPFNCNNSIEQKLKHKNHGN
jgi:hypothetical protein